MKSVSDVVAAYKSPAAVAEDCARVLALLEDATGCVELDAGQLLLLSQAASKVEQVLTELSLASFADDFEFVEGALVAADDFHNHQEEETVC